MEIDLRKEYLNEEFIETIYLGGGTPSLLNAEELQRLFDKLYHTFHVKDNPEVTLEANPDDLTKEKIRMLKTTPVNRLSIGVQSFHDDDLLFLNRAHNAQQAEASVRMAHDEGFENITIDLIYGIPTGGQETGNGEWGNKHPSFNKWHANLEKLKSFRIPHFSAYCLTIEPKTVLEKMIREKKSSQIDEAEAVLQFEALMDFAVQTGYDHYEISNFAVPGFYSRHNTSYWTGKKYLGLGPSAHSYDGESRQWNIANNTLYIRSLENEMLNFEKEYLTDNDRFNEYVMTNLRTKWGIDTSYLKRSFGNTKTELLEKNAAKFLSDSYLTQENGKFMLTPKGKLIADRIICDLFDTDCK